MHHATIIAKKSMTWLVWQYIHPSCGVNTYITSCYVMLYHKQPTMNRTKERPNTFRNSAQVYLVNAFDRNITWSAYAWGKSSLRKRGTNGQWHSWPAMYVNTSTLGGAHAIFFISLALGFFELLIWMVVPLRHLTWLQRMYGHILNWPMVANGTADRAFVRAWLP